MESNFAILQSEWPAIGESAQKAELLVNSDARAACFYARRSLELIVAWLYTYEKKLRLPYQDHLSALIHEPTFRATVGGAVFNKAKILKELGNQAVHTQKAIRTEAAGELAQQIAGLPSEIETDDEEAKRFDLLMLNLQLAQLNTEPGFMRLRDQVIAIAGLLEEQSSIPMIQQKMVLIQLVQSDEWWQDVTIPMLENVRRNLRLLIKLIEKKARKIVYTDFEDELGDEAPVELPGMTSAGGFEKFRAKARQFLKAHEDHIAIHKLRTNNPLTPSDLAELERMLTESGVGTPDDIAQAKIESSGLGLFVRSLVGLDRQAAKEALGVFLQGATLRANQIEFLDEIVNHLTEHGSMDIARLYESPYIDFSPQGVDGVFAPHQVDQLVSILEDVRQRAVI